MKIFNINRKENRNNNLLAIEELTNRQLIKQTELLKEWEKNFIESIEQIKLTDNNEFELLETADRFGNNICDMRKKIENYTEFLLAITKLKRIYKITNKQ